MVGDVYGAAQKVLAAWRTNGLNLAVDNSGRKLDACIKSAVKSGVLHVLFIGEQELASGKYKLKNLESAKELELDQEEVVKILKTE